MRASPKIVAAVLFIGSSLFCLQLSSRQVSAQQQTSREGIEFFRQLAANNPWGAGATTLEWSLPSPPPFHQFNTLPVIR